MVSTIESFFLVHRVTLTHLLIVPVAESRGWGPGKVELIKCYRRKRRVD